MKIQKTEPFKSPWSSKIKRNERHSTLNLTFVRKEKDGRTTEFVAPLGIVQWTQFTPDELAVGIMGAIGDAVIATVKAYSKTHPEFIEIVPSPDVPATGNPNKTKKGKPNMAIQKKSTAKKAVKKAAVKAPAKKAAVKAPAKKEAVKAAVKKAPEKKTCCCKCGKKVAAKKPAKK